MFVIWWRSVLAKLTNRKSRSGKRRPKGSKISSYRVWFEPLEDRFAPAAYIWTGGGTDTNWTDTSNWSGGTYPGSAAGDTAIFPSVTSETVTINAAMANPVGNISFTGGGYIINGSSGNALLLGNSSALGNLTATANETINANVTLGAGNQTWNVSTGNTLTIAGAVTSVGNITVGNSTATGTVAITGNVSFTATQTWNVANSTIFNVSGNVSNTAGNLTIGNTTIGYQGTVVLGGSNNFNGGLTIDGNNAYGATVQATANNALGNASSGNVTLNANNTTLQLNTGTGGIGSFPNIVLMNNGGNTTIENVNGCNTLSSPIYANDGSGNYTFLSDQGNLTLTANFTTLKSHTRTYNFGLSGGNITFSDPYAGDIGGGYVLTLNKTGGGTLFWPTPFDNGGHADNWNISGGTLSISGTAAFGCTTAGNILWFSEFHHVEWCNPALRHFHRKHHSIGERQHHRDRLRDL